MKRFLILIFIFLFSIAVSRAEPEKYYKYESNLDVKFVPLKNSKIPDKALRKEYKKVLKNEKYITKKKYSKAEKLMPDFIPNIARFINVCTDKKDFKKRI